MSEKDIASSPHPLESTGNTCLMIAPPTVEGASIPLPEPTPVKTP